MLHIRSLLLILMLTISQLGAMDLSSAIADSVETKSIVPIIWVELSHHFIQNGTLPVEIIELVFADWVMVFQHDPGYKHLLKHVQQYADHPYSLHPSLDSIITKYDPDVALWLLQNCLDTLGITLEELKDGFGRPPLYWAKLFRFKEVIKILEQATVQCCVMY